MIPTVPELPDPFELFGLDPEPVDAPNVPTDAATESAASAVTSSADDAASSAVVAAPVTFAPSAQRVADIDPATEPTPPDPPPGRRFGWKAIALLIVVVLLVIAAVRGHGRCGRNVRRNLRRKVSAVSIGTSVGSTRQRTVARSRRLLLLAHRDPLVLDTHDILARGAGRVLGQQLPACHRLPFRQQHETAPEHTAHTPSTADVLVQMEEGHAPLERAQDRVAVLGQSCINERPLCAVETLFDPRAVGVRRRTDDVERGCKRLGARQLERLAIVDRVGGYQEWHCAASKGQSGPSQSVRRPAVNVQDARTYRAARGGLEA